ncbi:MAG: M23 family metallopeptidase [Treponema sp.]|nr:M23 family metallopeptidase [Treponema sp.]
MKKSFLLVFIIFFLPNIFANETKNKNQYHYYLDEGTNIYAIKDGTILSYGYDVEQGNFLEIQYPCLSMTVRYCHLKKFFYFKNNQVFEGNLIGKSGYTGAINEPELMLLVNIDESFISNPLENLENSSPDK